MMTRAILMLLLACCASAEELIVAAASDLAPLGAALEAGFQKATGNTLRFTFGSSGSLSSQIENGAPYDVFLAASEMYAQDLVAKGQVLARPVTVYALGRVALWSPANSVRQLNEMTSLQVRHIAIANPLHAPYGVAAKQALERQGLWKQIEPKIVFGENVRQALQFAESGNADAVITSWTLLKGRGTLLPAEWHDPIRQTAVIVKSSVHVDTAKSLLVFLTSPAGQAILTEGGLFPVETAKPAPPAPAPAPKRPASTRRSSRRSQ
jgi:molybdate transport system substrate-binding protein